jgi:DNA-binding response OmpR family regulator
MAINRFQNPNPKTEQKSFSERDQLTDEAAREEIELNQQADSSHMDTTEWRSDLAAYVKMRILIVDDEPANVALLEDILGNQGYTHLKSTTDSRRVSELCREFDPDLILLDLFMPHLDGFAVLDSLRADRSEVYLPIIVLTADVNEETKRRALHGGATDFLHKPFDYIEVLLRIRNLLETRRIHQVLDNRRVALEEAVGARTSELQAVQAAFLDCAKRFRRDLENAQGKVNV